MRFHTATLAAASAILVSGCATTGALHRATEEQRAALAQERNERLAGDDALRQDLGQVRGDVAALRSELSTMRADFGARITAMQDGLHFAMPVNFGFNQDAVTNSDRETLNRFAHVAETYYPGSKVTIEGFTDPAGTKAYNLELSRRRASAVRRYLLSQGMSPSQLTTVGYGETRLVNPGAWGEKPGAVENRRVVFVIESRGSGSKTVAAR